MPVYITDVDALDKIIEIEGPEWVGQSGIDRFEILHDAFVNFQSGLAHWGDMEWPEDQPPLLDYEGYPLAPVLVGISRRRRYLLKGDGELVFDGAESMWPQLSERARELGFSFKRRGMKNPLTPEEQLVVIEGSGRLAGRYGLPYERHAAEAVELYRSIPPQHVLAAFGRGYAEGQAALEASPDPLILEKRLPQTWGEPLPPTKPAIPLPFEDDEGADPFDDDEGVDPFEETVRRRTPTFRMFVANPHGYDDQPEDDDWPEDDDEWDYEDRQPWGHLRPLTLADVIGDDEAMMTEFVSEAPHQGAYGTGWVGGLPQARQYLKRAMGVDVLHDIDVERYLVSLGFSPRRAADFAFHAAESFEEDRDPSSVYRPRPWMKNPATGWNVATERLLAPRTGAEQAFVTGMLGAPMRGDVTIIYSPRGIEGLVGRHAGWGPTDWVAVDRNLDKYTYTADREQDGIWQGLRWIEERVAP